MKCNTQIYFNNKLFRIRNHSTKKDAIKYKQSILGGFTVVNKVKYNIQVIINKGLHKSKIPDNGYNEFIS